MNPRRSLLTGVVLGVLIAGILAFLLASFVTRNVSFFVGFVACLACVIIASLLVYLWNRRFPAPDVESGRTGFYRWLYATFVVVLIGLLGSILITRHYQSHKSRVAFERESLAKQAKLILSVRRSAQLSVMGNILDRIDDELADNPQRTLSDETIARIAALCYAFKPYVRVHSDHTSTRTLSPERGQLLLLLCKMEIDTNSLRRIFLQGTFAGADLADASLGGSYLKGVDLAGADLRGAALTNAVLSHANLSSGLLWGATLNAATLEGANLRSTDLSWAEMNNTNLKGATMDGARVVATEMREANLSTASVQWVDMNGAFLEEADLTGAKLFGTIFERAYLEKTNFTGAYLRMSDFTNAVLVDADLTRANLTESVINGADLRGAVLDQSVVSNANWLAQLDAWDVAGAPEIVARYELADFIHNETTLYRLMPR